MNDAFGTIERWPQKLEFLNKNIDVEGRVLASKPAQDRGWPVPDFEDRIASSLLTGSEMPPPWKRIPVVAGA